jgi:hypothetical protein
MKFVIESSSVPIYNRIAEAYANTLIEFGHIVYFIDVKDFNELDYVNIINDIDIDYYISTNELNLIQKKSDIDALFLFEKIYANIIFIHHDNLFSAFHSIDYIDLKLKALESIKLRSYHFCLESSNVELLNSLGFIRAFKINHASEFTNDKNVENSKWGVTFIGHLMSSLNLYPTDSVPGGHHLQALAWNRLTRSSFSIQSKIQELIQEPFILQSLGIDAVKSPVATKQFLIAGLNKFSSPMRGHLISLIKNNRIDIFGGDLSYGRLSDSLLILKQNNIFYQPATQNYQDAADIYKSSRISLNISALQFDTAINNRVFDVISSGGFILTDKRNDLFDYFPCASEISFETPEELIDKINYWSSSSVNYKYNELKNYLYTIVKNNYNYQKCLSSILDLI